ncbi:hypothetical protein [Dactylosporangium darangshiense]
MESDPTVSARQLADAADALAASLATDVEIDTTEVFAPLVAATLALHTVANELALAAMSVDETAAAAARRAAAHFMGAQQDLIQTLRRLPQQ